MSNDINWTPTLTSLGFPAEFLTHKNCPCPFCGGKDRFRYTDFEGKGKWICSHCQPEGGNGFELVKRYWGLTFEEALNKVNGNRIVAPTSHGISQQRKYDQARTKMISQYRSLVGGRNTPAHYYLNKRGIPFPDPFYQSLDPEVWGARDEVFGCFWLPEFEDGYGAMVWKALDPSEKKVSQLHFTILDQNGDKAPVNQQKKYSRAIYKIDKDAFRVAPLIKGDPSVCMIAEGIETALSCGEIYRKLAPDEPCPTIYASMDAGMLKKFKPYMPHSGGQTWFVCGDNDESQTGQQAAASCAMSIGAMTGNYASAKVVLPRNVGQDWNDVLMSGDEDLMMDIVRPLL